MDKFWGGFFDMSHFKSDTHLRSFFEDALKLSYGNRIDIKDDTYARVICTTHTLSEVMDMISIVHHNVCIDRTIQNIYDFDIDDGEVGFCTMGEERDIFLYLFLSKENLHKLATDYKLKRL